MTQPIITRSRAEAAQERQQQIAKRAGMRPSQRRAAQQIGSGFGVRAAVAGIQVRAKSGSTALSEFEGHASVTEKPYEMYDWYGPYTEVISAGAFDASLKRTDLDVPLVLNHDQMRRIASTTSTVSPLSLTIDDVGLFVQALSLDAADHDVSYILPKLRAGLIKEMSFAFRIDAGVWSPDYSEYRIDKVDIHKGDVAIVGYGANPLTDAGVREEPKAPAAEKRDDGYARAMLELALSD